MIVGIIGGGASGMAAALTASENADVRVILFERQSRLGRKLQATGNGRCNLSNLYAAHYGYNGSHPEFAKPALIRFSPFETIGWFNKMGLYITTEPTGRMYPYSDQANSVVDVLRLALMRPNVEVRLGEEITKLRRCEGGFLVGDTFCDRVIVACGGLAGTKLGGSMSGYQLLRAMGHHMTKLRPSLVQLKCSWGIGASLKGVRAECHATIYKDGEIHRESTGEIQFTEYGLSGPVIFEISRDACQGNGHWTCQLDLLTHGSEQELLRTLEQRRKTAWTCEDLLTGVIHNRLGRMIVKASGISLNTPIKQLSDKQLEEICYLVKAFEIPITEPLGMDSAQVTAGGILTEEFDPDTMQSKLVPGLYACGEVLDIDGECGGYNLQWAWSSGRCAGDHAGKEIHDQNQ